MEVRTIRGIIEGQELVTAPATMLVIDAARLMRERRVGAVIVVDYRKLVGVFTERDALFRVVAEGLDPGAVTLEKVMTRDVKTIAPDKPFGDALHMMYEGRFRHVPVVENGIPIGIVSARDAMGPELEQFMYGLIVEGQMRDVLA
jgi:CBS domain-containing protein